MQRPWVQSTRFVLLVVGSVVFVAPLLWMVSTSLKPIEQTMQMPPQWLAYQWTAPVDGQRVDVTVDASRAAIEAGGPVEVRVVTPDGPGPALTVDAAELQRRVDPQYENYGQAIEAMKYFPQYLRNSLVLCALSVIGTVCSSAVVAYGFSRISWPGRDKVFIFVLATIMIPFPVIMVPLYSVFRELGWIGTLRPLWVPTFFGHAFSIFLLRQFFMTIPRELSEAARIDGCNELQIFGRIILPLVKPAITVVALFQFLYTWNDFLGPLIYLTDQRDFTLALGLQFFQSQQGGTQWHYLMAASTIVVLPIIVLFFLAQRTFIEGVSMTGLKG